MGTPDVWRNPGAPLHQDNAVATVVMIFSSRNWETSRDRGTDENLPPRALNLRLGQQFNDPQNMPEHQSPGNVFWMCCNQQEQNLPAGAKPTGPVGRNPSEAQSNISFSSFSRSLPATEKDLEHLSAASCR